MSSHYRRYAAAALIYATGFAYILLRWDAIPDPVTVHVGPTGEADSFAPKTLLSASLLMIVGVVLSAVMPLFLPPRSLARHTVEVPAEGALPVSETAARRVEKLCDASADVISKMILAMAALFAVMNISMVVPDVKLPFWLEIVLWIGFTVYVVVIAVRMTSAKDGIEPDAEEQVRNENLRYQGGMGTYSAPNDPMAVAVLPSNPGKIAVNTAHAPGKQYLRRVVVSVVVLVAVTMAIGVTM
ncbi:putative membrane protein [Corynebacterium afermentans]